MVGPSTSKTIRSFVRPEDPLGFLKLWFVLVSTISGVLLIATGVTLRWMGLSVSEILTSLELEVIAATVAYLAVLSIYTTRSSEAQSEEIQRTERLELQEMRKAFREETSRLLARNEEHWKEQATALEMAAQALREGVALQSNLLDEMRKSLQLDQQLIELEKTRERMRRDEEELKRRKLQPELGLGLVVPSGQLDIKHMKVFVHNRGMDGKGLVVWFGVEGSEGSFDSQAATTIDSRLMLTFDFGDIKEWPDDAAYSMVAEVADVLGNRYQFSARVVYHRNRRMVGSTPFVEPSDMVYPPATLLK